MDQPTNSLRTDGASPSQPSGVLFREIHKNAWLKKLPTVEKRTGAFPKKGERVWVVFCVHDDVEAFLETYNDQKLAVTHKPDWFVSLNNCLHISPTICAQEDEYEFVVTLATDIVRLTAPSWDTMMEWVETIRSKLREMKILSPRENIYSKMPELRLPLAPTRDPNSPLPLPPAGPSGLLPGIEPVQLYDVSDSTSSSATASSTEVSSSSDSSDDQQQIVEYDDVSLEIGLSTTSLYITQSEPQLYSRHQRSLSRATSVTDSPSVYSSSRITTPSTGQSEASVNNVTVIEVNEHTVPASSPGVFNFNFVEDASSSLDTSSSDTVNENVDVNEPYFTPPQTPTAVDIQVISVLPRVAIRDQTDPNNGNSPLEVVQRGNSHYECVFLPTTDVSPSATRFPSHPPPVESSFRNEPTLTETVPHIERVPQRRRRSSSTSETNASSPRSFPLPERGRLVIPDGERRLQAAPHPYRQQGAHAASVEGRLTLRERQVLQLRREMLHPGGVRLQLRRKDCMGSIALIDAFGGVWISGWKQKEHPMLYNALHIGDQLLSVAGVLVQSSSDAHKLIRGANSLYVEFVVRRIPFGRVYALRRDAEGQNLGIIQEGNTAVIRDVVQGGLAARHGLSAKVQTCDGLSLTLWVLTEINGRPLNLFYKDNEIRDRLNAVGKEISILVQPFDLVKQLKKQLKSLRSYKDYIVQ